METGHLYNDSDMFARIAAGDTEAFRAVYDRYIKELYYAALKMTKSPSVAEDIVQETFIKLWVNRARLQELESPDAYLFRMLFNRTKDYLRKESNRKRILNDSFPQRLAAGNTTEQMMDVHETEKYVTLAIDQLTVQQKAVYLLRRKEGLSIDQIAARLELSPNTVKRHLTRAQENIRSYLKDITFITALLTAFRNFHSF